MELLQNLLSLLFKDFDLEKFKPLLNLFKDGEFNLNNFLSNLNFENLAPLIKEFMNINSNEKCSTEFVEHSLGLKPISSIADKDIIYALNQYFCQCDYS